MKNRKIGNFEYWKVGKIEKWKIGKSEGRKIRNSENWKLGNSKNWKIGKPETRSPFFFYIFVIGHLECRKFGKSKNGKIWRYGSPKIRKFKNLENRTFGNSQNRRFGKTEIRQIAKSERKGILKNKRITGMSVKLLFHPHLRVSRPSGHFYNRTENRQVYSGPNSMFYKTGYFKSVFHQNTWIMIAHLS